MDILTDYRITALTVSERDLAQRAERARIALERAAEEAEPAEARTTATGSVCIPVAAH
jgi:hypothetical protein